MKRIKIIAIILILISAILYLINFAVYKAVLSILDIFGFSFLVVSILSVLGVSTIVAIILGMRYYNLFTKIYYLFSMIWLGFLGYFFLASVLYLFLSAYMGNSIRFWGITLLSIATAVGIYGLMHANKFVIKNITIKLTGLPEIWQGRKAVWISDIHLGQIYGRKYTERIVKKIQNISPDILFIGGDIFDGGTSPDILKFIEPLRELSVPLGKYFITGNHEEFESSDKFIAAIKSTGIRILQDEMVEIEGVQLIGVDYNNASNKDRFQKILSELSIDKNKVSILLKHEPRHIAVAEQAGISFQISGHTHKAQQWPLGYLANLVYGRFAYGLNKLGNMQVYISSGVGTWGPPIRVGTDSEIVIITFMQ